jgi:hypothetical protein
VGADGAPVVGWLEAGGEDAESARLFGGLAVVVVAVGVAWALATLVPGVAWRVFLAFVLLLAVAPVAVGAGWLLRWERVTADPEGGAKPRRDHFVSRPAVAGGAVVVGWWVALWWGVWSAVPLLVGVGVLVGVLVMRTSAVVVARRGVELHGGAGKHPAERVYELWAQMTAPPAKGQSRKEVSSLVGSALTEVRMLTDGGWTGAIRLPLMTDATWEAVAAERGRIAKVFGTTRAWVHIGPYRTGAATHASITVHRTDALAKPILWQPTLDARGAVTVAWAADGTPIRWNLWQGEKGARHGLVVGATGSGKSSPLAAVLLEAGMSPHCWTVLMDPKGGLSIPSMTADRVDHLAVDEESILRALSGVLGIMEARIKAGAGNVRPSRSLPLVVAVLDEAPDILVELAQSDAIVRDVIRPIVRKGRAVNVGLYLGAQHPLVDELGGSAVRAQLANVAAMRLDDLAARQVMGAWLGGVDMSTIPDADGQEGRGFFRGSPLQGRAVYPTKAALPVFDAGRQRIQLDALSRAAWDAAMTAPISTEESA